MLLPQQTGALTIDPSGTSSVGFLNVTVSKAGYGEDSSTRVTVIL